MIAAPPAVAVERVSKSFGATHAVRDLSLTVPTGAFFALLGPSGCGKTTLMRLIAGFETPDAGVLRIDGVDMAGVPPERRPVNMMFQSYALFPHMTVAGNIGYGLRRAGLPQKKVAEGVDAMLGLVQLAGLGNRRPDQLSGGQRQRVALARALARKPRILLLDEPMGALDRKLREETQFALKDIQRELGTTFVVVTHDQDEAMGLADAVALMREGAVEQIGSPADLYERPASRFAAGFIGETNVVQGIVRSVEGDRTTIATVDGDVPARTRLSLETGATAVLVIRPECFGLAAGETAEDAAFSGLVHDAAYRGSSTLVRVRLASSALLRVAVSGSSPVDLRSGTPVTLRVSPDDVWLLRD